MSGSLPPFPPASTFTDQLARLQAELRALVDSEQLRLAMAHRDTPGDHPRFRAIRRRGELLRARIGELTDA